MAPTGPPSRSRSRTPVTRSEPSSSSTTTPTTPFRPTGVATPEPTRRARLTTPLPSTTHPPPTPARPRGRPPARGPGGGTHVPALPRPPPPRRGTTRRGRRSSPAAKRRAPDAALPVLGPRPAEAAAPLLPVPQPTRHVADRSAVGA